MDATRSQTSKKDEKLRTEEIRKAASEPLLAWVAKDGAEVIRDPGGSLLVTEVMLYAEGGTFAPSHTVDIYSTHPISDTHCNPDRQNRSGRNNS